MTTIPARFQNLHEARAQFGDRVDRLAPFLLRGDPLADAVVEEMDKNPKTAGFGVFQAALNAPSAAKLSLPPAMAAFFGELERVPAWVDFGGMKRGAELFQRAGTLGAFTLATASLVLGYASPAGNKPLVFSGRLVEMAPRRLAETSRFVQMTAQEGGLLRTGEAYRITLKVRIMHAKVRRLLRQTPSYRADLWGDPINQHDMAATTLLFSLAFLEGLRAFGVEIDKDEAESFMHLWRYSGFLMGVDQELLPTSEFDAWNLANLIKATQGAPDQDSRALTAALFDSGIGHARSQADVRAALVRKGISQAVCRGLIGDDLADSLGVPRTRYSAAFHAMRAVTRVAEQARLRSNEAHRLAIRLGARYWERVVSQTLGGHPADFAPPDRLSRAA